MIYSKKLLIYLLLVLYAAPQFSLFLKQTVLAPVSLRPRLLMSPLCSDWSAFRKLSINLSNEGYEWTAVYGHA